MRVLVPSFPTEGALHGQMPPVPEVLFATRIFAGARRFRKKGSPSSVRVEDQDRKYATC